MTELLYWKDSYAKEAAATLIRIENTELGPALVLDETIFYPEGGGQPSDWGTIGSLAVKDVQIKGDDVFHYVEGDLPEPGQRLKLSINWQRRFDHMQQHSGQHLLSAIAFRAFGASTVGFHLSESYTTVDLDKKLSRDELIELEHLCLQMIVAPRPFKVLYPDADTLDALPLRKKPTVDEGIRVVALDDYDYSPCGGTHLRSTAEIGMLKIRSADHYKQGMRLEFVCGFRALKDFQFKTALIQGLTQTFSAPEGDLTGAVDKKLKSLDDLQLENRRLREKICALEAQQIIEAIGDTASLGEGQPLFFHLYEDQQAEDLKAIAINVTENVPGTALCLISTKPEEKGGQIVLACSKDVTDFNCRDLFSQLKKTQPVKGGGSPLLAQGAYSSPLTAEALIDAIRLQASEL